MATPALDRSLTSSGAVKGSSIIVSFPSAGPLASLIQGQITISHAESMLVCPPVITSINPNAGPTSGGNTVTIAGTGFNGATGVSFGGTPSPNFQVTSDVSITAVAPGEPPVPSTSPSPDQRAAPPSRRLTTTHTCRNVMTSTGTLVVAGVPVTVPTTPNSSVNVTAPATGNAVLASVTFNLWNV